MKNKLAISLTLLVLLITACGGQSTPTPPGPAAPTQAVSQPTQASTSASIATDVTVETTKPVTGASVAGVSFAKDVMPILANSCSECHGGKQMKEGLDLRTYESLIAGSFNGTVLVAGNSADSLLVQQLVNGKMPKRGPKLTPAQIKVISDWIDAGALNN